MVPELVQMWKHRADNSRPYRESERCLEVTLPTDPHVLTTDDKEETATP